MDPFAPYRHTAHWIELQEILWGMDPGWVFLVIVALVTIILYEFISG
jgi:hypothetical protein